MILHRSPPLAYKSACAAGITDEMSPKPVYVDEDYKGTGKLEGKVCGRWAPFPARSVR